MIDQPNTHEDAGRRDPPRDREVVGTRRHVAGGMVVAQHDAGGVAQQGDLEDVARMHDRRIHGAAREFVVHQHMLAGRQAQEPPTSTTSSRSKVRKIRAAS
jgi:hypothetical protein